MADTLGPRARPTAPLDRRQFALGAALLGVATAGIVLKPRRSFQPPAPGTLEHALPSVIGSWRYLTTDGVIAAPEDELSKRLYDQLLMRVYEGPGGVQLALLIAYGSAQNSALQLHRPENCYPAQGYAIGERRLTALPLGRAQATACLLTAERADDTEQLLYWARIDRDFTVDNASDRAAIVRANLRGYLPDGVLVRLSTHANDAARATALMRDFNNLMLASLSGIGRKMLLGQAA